MPGMLVQCSIQESLLHNLTESRVRALQGNQLISTPSYKNLTVYRATYGSSSMGQILINFNPDGSFLPTPYFSSPADYYTDAYSKYGTVTSIYTDPFSVPPFNFLAPYTYVSTCSGGGASAAVPSISGLATNKWGNVPSVMQGAPSLVPGTSSNTAATFSSGGDSLAVTLTGLINFGADWATLAAYAGGLTWNWSIGPGQTKYNTGFFFNNSDISSGVYDNAISGGSYTFGSGFSFGAFAESGWTYQNSYLGYSRGLAKNTTNVEQPYFIAHYRGFAAAGTGGQRYPTGLTVTLFILEIVSSGIIQKDQVIGSGQDIDLPFPVSDPTSMIVVGNNLLVEEAYVAVIGEDPGLWAASAGYNLGTTTMVT